MLGSNPNAETVIALVWVSPAGPINCEPEATVLIPWTIINENKKWRDWWILWGRIIKQWISEATTHEEVYNLMSE